MPELPEVETIRRGLEQRLRGKQVRKVEVWRKTVIKGSAAGFRRVLTGSTLTKFERRGKYLILQLGPARRHAEPTFLVVHLRMTGQLIYERGKQRAGGGHPWPPLSGTVLPNQHTRVAFTFADASRLFYNDVRAFGLMKVVAGQAALEAMLAKVGVEPLGPEYNWLGFKQFFQAKNVSIKAALLEQRYVAGLGNIYADEVAFAARILPARPARELSERELKKIYGAIPRILRAAIRHGGTTFRDYRDAAGQQGNYVGKLKVYGRGGLPCRRCGALLKRTVVAQRGTVYCPICQT